MIPSLTGARVEIALSDNRVGGKILKLMGGILYGMVGLLCVPVSRAGRKIGVGGVKEV